LTLEGSQARKSLKRNSCSLTEIYPGMEHSSFVRSSSSVSSELEVKTTIIFSLNNGLTSG